MPGSGAADALSPPHRKSAESNPLKKDLNEVSSNPSGIAVPECCPAGVALGLFWVAYILMMRMTLWIQPLATRDLCCVGWCSYLFRHVPYRLSFIPSSTGFGKR
jgi:hypothetical protein